MYRFNDKQHRNATIYFSKAASLNGATKLLTFYVKWVFTLAVGRLQLLFDFLETLVEVFASVAYVNICVHLLANS